MKLSKLLLKEEIKNLLEYYKEYPNEEKVKNIKQLEEKLENQEYKIAVVANMSSGKSTFINALFGEEVLPAFNHATTDCATFIYSKPNTEKKAIIYFNDNKKPVEIKNNIEKEIKQYAQKDSECKDNKYKNVEKIKLYYPFKNLQTSLNEDLNIVFIDTPGPNSTGENYKQKHKDQTRKVLNEVDLVLFMFDYAQLDANLSSDEQGLWNTIKKRYEKDKNFDVYFLLNKIDYALNDNFKEIDTTNREEFIKKKQEKWYIHEKLAIDKLEIAAQKHSIKNPKIYPIVSKFQLLSRDNNKNWDAEDELDRFKKSHFQRLFSDDWEEKFIEYLGIDKLEKDINSYIHHNVKDKILLKINSILNRVKSEEKQYLKQKIEILKKPKDEAEKNLNNATIFLNNKAEKMEREFKKKSIEIQEKYINDIRTIIDDNIEKELKRNLTEATNRTIKFLELLLSDYKEFDAISIAKSLPKEKIKNHLNENKINITIQKRFEVELLETNIQKFIKSILNDYKNNYLDMKIEIKNNYKKLSEEISNLFNNYKKEFEQELQKNLNLENIEIDEKLLYTTSNFDDKISVPDSTIDYKYQSEEWRGGGSFSDRKKIQEEKHYIIISPKKIKKIFELATESIKRTYYSKEVKTYEDTIIKFIKFYQDQFNDFKELKKEEIKEIEKDLEDTDEKLNRILIRDKKFEKIQRKI